MNGNDADSPLTDRSRLHRDHPPGYLPVVDSVASLTTDIKRVGTGKRIVLVVGEASPDVYNSEAFMNAARDASAHQKARISVLTGPIMLVPDGSDEPNGLVQLLGEQVLTGLHHRPARFAMEHFRVVETCGTPAIYVEDSHPPLHHVTERSCVNFFNMPDAEIRIRAKDALKSFKFWKGQSTRHKLNSASPGVLFATESTLRALLLQAEDEDLDFNYLNAEELLGLAQRSGQVFVDPWTRPPRLLETPIVQRG